MNAAQANAIPMPEVLAIIGYHPVKGTSTRLQYYSPFRTETTPSFFVNIHQNTWYDFGEAIGYTVVDFVCAYLTKSGESDTVRDALRWLDNMTFLPCPSPCVPCIKEQEEASSLELRSVHPINHDLLAEYLQLRGIPLNIAKEHVEQASVFNKKTGNIFNALAMRNESGGYELRNQNFKGCVAPKDVSFIRGRKTSEGAINVFEGFIDFVSALLYQDGNRFEHDALLLNSITCLQKAFAYIETCPYGTIRTWFDNDHAGRKTNEAFNDFAKAKGLKIEAMNKIYAPYKDVNAWHMNRARP